MNSESADRTDQVAILIDMANLYHIAQSHGAKIDYDKLRIHLAQNKQLLRTYAYVVEDPESERSRSFITWLRRSGFRVVSKPLQRFPDGQMKGNLDVELAVDMMELAPYVKCMILVSGDGDFTRLVEAVQDKGVRVMVAGFNGSTSQRLIQIADEYVDLEKILPQIQIAGGYMSLNG